MSKSICVILPSVVKRFFHLMKKQNHFRTLLLLLCAWLGARTAQAQSPGTVVAWGWNGRGQTDVPVAAQSGVTAIAAGLYHTVALLGTPVSLHARPSGNELILSWPTNAVGFTLQSTLDLTPPVTWMDSTNPRAVLGAQFTVTNTITGSARFYRLRRP